MVVDTENMTNDFDLITNNEHLHESEVRQEHNGGADKWHFINVQNPLVVVADRFINE